MGYALEVELIARARAKDVLTTPYLFSASQAVDMTKAGADIIVCHMGLTTRGSIGAGTALTLDQCVDKISAWTEAAHSVRDDVLVICHGGPISIPDDAAYILSKVKDCAGFYGASSTERLPTETAITAQVHAFAGMGR